MKTFLTIFVLAGASVAFAQNPLTTELKNNYNQIKGTVTKAAADMPEANYGFVPGEGSRTYGQAVVHLAEVQAGLCGMASGTEAPKIDGMKTSKAEAEAALKTAFDYCDPIYAAMTDAEATKMVKMFGRDVTKFQALNFGVIHDNEMYGTLAVYLRAKGTVPPSTAGRGAMGKKKM
jgi:uncharacterized damage-inducible protein DinB